MSQFLNKVRDVDPNDSEAVKEAVTAFFQNLSKHKDIDCNRWLRALENVINRFPKYCGQHRVAIEIYLNHFLDCANYYNLIEAAKCAHAVQQVRPQQEKTASAKSCWRDQMTSLCDAAHTLNNALFSKSVYKLGNQTKASQSTNTPLQEALSEIDVVTKPQDIANKRAVLCTRLRNVLVFIQAMLVEVYPVAKPIYPQLILQVILQVISACGNEDLANLTTVKGEALRTLDAMVACLGSNFIPFSSLVFRFVMQTLRWSSEQVSEDTRRVRCAAYRSLTRWLAVLRVHKESRAHVWDDELTSHLLGDVTPPKHLIQLTANAQPMKNLSKKARKKLANSMLMQSNISSHMPGERNKINLSEESNDEVAVAALECAEMFLISCGIFLKPTTHKQFQELLVRECHSIDGYAPERGLWLLRALEACRKSASPAVPPPTQYCLLLYSNLLNSDQPEISKFSSQALLDIRLHLHCSPPSLNFSLERPQQTKAEEKRKRVSERNRAVLESLLGKERMPSELAEDEIITIPDEPTTKRPRIDIDETDKISLSSGESVQIEPMSARDVTDDSSVEEVEELDDSNEIDYIIEPINHEKPRDMDLEQCSTSIPDESDETDAEEIQRDDEINGETEIGQNNEINTQKNEIDGKNNVDAETLSQETSDSQTENIFEAETQMPTESNDANEGDKSPPLSMEVAYDYPSTGQEKVKVLEKMEEDNLPSTNETDDVQITCGQTVKSSQDDNEKESEVNGMPKENGIEKSPERIVENAVVDIEVVASKIVPNEGEVTVEDMLADFVDEVNDESQTQA